MGATGKVYLVGAGPGHPELLTIKAANLIKAADVIVYDRLIQEDVLALAKPSAERIYMGKPVGRHDSRQDEVNELLVHKARQGKMVVRLKGGDPFLFGRGGEEAEYLAEHGVSFDVIPGVSSALSAPLSAGIPVTHRDSASAVAIVTGHFCGGDGDDVDFNALSKIPTLVFLMGVHAVGQIAKRLIAEGRNPGTPAAIIQMAFWHGEQVVSGTLETIAEEAKLHGIKAPATLVIGEVVRLREKLKRAERELQRRGEADARFAPGPSPQELFRLATAGVGSQMLAWAVSAGVFEALEHPKTVCNLALQIHADADALNDMMQVLVALGLVEARPDGYRNLELASLYLRRNSPQVRGHRQKNPASRSCGPALPRLRVSGALRGAGRARPHRPRRLPDGAHRGMGSGGLFGTDRGALAACPGHGRQSGTGRGSAGGKLRGGDHLRASRFGIARGMRGCGLPRRQSTEGRRDADAARRFALGRGRCGSRGRAGPPGTAGYQRQQCRVVGGAGFGAAGKIGPGGCFGPTGGRRHVNQE
jgi:uroporphyrin-III C-methyltransferase